MNIADVQWLGDWALILRFGQCIDAEVLERVQTATAALTEAQLPAVRDLVPAYASITITLDPSVASRLHAGQLDRDLLSTQIVEIIDKNPANPFIKVYPAIEIPVRYGGDFGPDLDALAHSAQLDPNEVVRRHCAPEYRVAMLGFAPGFPYLLGLDASLHTPRRAAPRTRVPAGSVAIGGGQTGIYPRDLPGGWHIIGRTGLALFDVARQPPALLAPGQRVRFVAIASHSGPPIGPP